MGAREGLHSFKGPCGFRNSVTVPIRQLAGCFVSLCVVDIGIVGVVVDTLIRG